MRNAKDVWFSDKSSAAVMKRLAEARNQNVVTGIPYPTSDGRMAIPVRTEKMDATLIDLGAPNVRLRLVKG